MKKRGLVISLLVMLAVITSGFTYAFWAAGVTGPDAKVADGTISVGTGESISTSITLTGDDFTGGNLVPATFAGSGDVEWVSIPLTVVWNASDALGALDGSTTTGTLQITVTVTATKGGSAVEQTLVDDLVNVVRTDVLGNSITLGAAAMSIGYTVTLDEPANLADYNAISGAIITVSFSITVINPVTA
jgi:hypothetical protein